MTEPERAALDHIRQVVDSVIGVQTLPEPPVAGGTAAVLSVPFYSPAGDDAIGDSGAAAGVMLVRAYGNKSITPADFYEQTGVGAGYPLSFTQIMNALGVNAVAVELRSNLKLSDLALILFSGRPAIVPIQQTVLQQAGLTSDAFDGSYYVVVVGMDMKQVYIHDPLRQDASGQAQAVPVLTFYQAWTQAQGYERAVLVPRQQLVRRVRVTSRALDVYSQPGGVEAKPSGTVSFGDVFEITQQKSGWGRISEERWIDLSYTAEI
jgi:hypothetical protein